MKIEDLTAATKVYSQVAARCYKAGTITSFDRAMLNDNKTQYGFDEDQCEVFADVLKTKDFEYKLRQAVLDVYVTALLDLKTEYLDNHEKSKYLIADEIMDKLV